MDNMAIRSTSGYRRRARRWEKDYYYNYEYDPFVQPLRVVVAGMSRFREGDFFRNINRKVFSMNIITLGNADWTQNSEKGTVMPGDVFLAHTGKNQYFTPGSEKYVHKRYLLADGPALATILHATGLAEHNTVRPQSPQHIVNLFRRIYLMMREKKDDYTLNSSLLLYEILFELGKGIAKDYPSEVRHGIEFMRRNLSADLNLATLSKELNFSVRHCSRLFQKHLGMSPIQFFIGLKMEWAQKLLTHSSTSIKEIALLVGYEDPLYFSIQFRKRFECSPRAYRAKLLSN